jgi:putative ABC transport system permease protein
MAVRERTREWAVLRTLGFERRHLAALITGEALLIAALGSIMGIAMTIPAIDLYATLVSTKLGNFFQQLVVYPSTLVLGALATLITACCAAAIPLVTALRSNVADDLRHIG